MTENIMRQYKDSPFLPELKFSYITSALSHLFFNSFVDNGLVYQTALQAFSAFKDFSHLESDFSHV